MSGKARCGPVLNGQGIPLFRSACEGRETARVHALIHGDGEHCHEHRSILCVINVIHQKPIVSSYSLEQSKIIYNIKRTFALSLLYQGTFGSSFASGVKGNTQHLWTSSSPIFLSFLYFWFRRGGKKQRKGGKCFPPFV